MLWLSSSRTSEGGDDARVGPEVVAVVVVARVLPAEDGARLGHHLLDDGVAHLGADGHAAHFGHDLGHHVGADEVVEDRLARVLGQHGRGHQRRRQRAGHGLGLLVDQEDAVGVAVEGQADVGAVLEHRRLQRHQVLGLDRVGRVVREVPSSSGNRISTVKGSRSNTMGTTSPPMPLAVSATTLSGRSDADVDEGHDVVGPLVEQVLLGPASLQGRQRLAQQLLGPGFDVGQAGVAPDRARPGQAELEAVVLRRVVRRREHGAGRVEMARREVQEVGGGHAEVDDVDAFGPHPVGEGGRQLHAALAHVAGHQDLGVPTKRAMARPMARHMSASSWSGTVPRTSYALKTWSMRLWGVTGPTIGGAHAALRTTRQGAAGSLSG